MSWAPALFLPAPLHGLTRVGPPGILDWPTAAVQAPAFHLTPRYPGKSPLDDVLRLVAPGLDEYTTEKYAAEIMDILGKWSEALRSSPLDISAVVAFSAPKIEFCPLVPVRESVVRSDGGMEVLRRHFGPMTASSRDQFLEEIKKYFAQWQRLETAEFQIVAIAEGSTASSPVAADIRYDLVGICSKGSREERIGLWRTGWTRDESSGWHAIRWEAGEETLVRAQEKFFIEVTEQAFGEVESYRYQMLRGADYWRTVLDGACGIDVYGNNGIALGDVDNDGFDDLYVCQPPGLPNRLYRNRGDGTFEDVTEKSDLGLLDGTACALFADFENKGLQDLLVVCATGPQLFLNQGNGKFELKRDAFQFAQVPQGTFTHAALADYDGDGCLDIYFCLYSYYLGLDQYHYPAPYFDARNGPPNFLMHNEGNGRFQDRTEAAGLKAENDRYSFACAWGDYTGDGRPSLYVANDFGRNNLYRNNGDGTFTAVSDEAHVNDVGAGMSATWFDFDNDGRQDIYVANMWSAAGLRVSQQAKFHEKESEDIRALYRQHAHGNSLYRNGGNGKFENVSTKAGVDMGRWAWCSDAWDFDQDGYSDLYVANGYVSGIDARDVSSFFWRQVVGKSPSTTNPSENYEHGWNAINELIRSDASWSGRERNVLYLNNHDGTFSEVSGAVGLDFPDDSRSFALADLDHDGRPEMILKNRNTPQLRLLRNSIKDVGNSVIFRLRGVKSNRDAIGAAIIVETDALKQTRYLQAGSGFLAQHSKELIFGVGKTQGPIRAIVRWPSGLNQVFENLPVNRRLEIHEGSVDFHSERFASAPQAWTHSVHVRESESIPSSFETWLIQPLPAPDFSLADVAGNLRNLHSFRGNFVLLAFWASAATHSIEQLQNLHEQWRGFQANDVRILGINVDDPVDPIRIRKMAGQENLPFPNLLATSEVTGIYNILYRFLFDRRRDLPIPCCFLIDPSGRIIKVYQGHTDPERIIQDVKSVPQSEADRIRKALQFPGRLPDDGFQRNDFTYGVALFQRGFLDQAAASFKQVITAKPDYPEAYYNLGTLCLRAKQLADAREYLEHAVQLRPNYPEAWNNLGMIAAESGQTEEAIDRFQHSLSLRPSYTVALINLGNLYRSHKNYDEAAKSLLRALELEPDNPEVNYGVGMLYARQDKIDLSLSYLEKAVQLRPDYPEAINNIGVSLVRAQRYAEAEEKFKACVRIAPEFDQGYLNLARLYAMTNNEQKAREILQTLLRIQPGNKMAQQALEMLH